MKNVKCGLFMVILLLNFLSCDNKPSSENRTSENDSERELAEGAWLLKLDSECDTCFSPSVRVDIMRSGADNLEAVVSDTANTPIGRFFGQFTNGVLRLVETFTPAIESGYSPDYSSRDTLFLSFNGDSVSGNVSIPDEFFSMAELDIDSSFADSSSNYGAYKLLNGSIDPSDSTVFEKFVFEPASSKVFFSGKRILGGELKTPEDFYAKQLSAGSAADKLCGTISDIVNGILTIPGLDLVTAWYRPMGGCGYHKDGGGFYLNGYRGAGLLTYSVYIPLEVTACANRQYTFHAKIKEEWIALTLLKGFAKVTNAQHLLDMAAVLVNKMSNAEKIAVFGTTNVTGSLLEEKLGDMCNYFTSWSGGGFGVSVVMNTRNHTASIYVSVKNNETAKNHHSSIVNHWFIKLLGLMGPKGHSVYVGSDIRDCFHLNRTTVPVPAVNRCTSPLFFIYVIGTHVVQYE